MDFITVDQLPLYVESTKNGDESRVPNIVHGLRRPTGTWWQADYLGLLPLWESQWFILIEINTYFDIFFLGMDVTLLPLDFSQHHCVWDS